MDEVIYQKTYPLPEIEPIIDAEQHGRTPVLSFEEFMEKANAVELIPIPERQELAEHFAKSAIQVSEEYEIDLMVTKCDELVSACFTVESGPCAEALKPLFILADRYFFTVCKDYRLMLSLDFYTHEVYREGKKLAP